MKTKASLLTLTKCGFVVHCRCGELAEIESLTPHPSNDNLHPPEQLDLFGRMLREKGWRKPIVVSRQTGRIVAGEGSWRAARKAGALEVPVDRQDFESEAEELRHLTADNQLAGLARPDVTRTGENLMDLDEWNRGLTGFTEKFIDDLMASPAEGDGLREISPKPLPRYGWVLIGVPLESFGLVQAALDALHGSLPPETVLEVAAGKAPDLDEQENGQ